VDEAGDTPLRVASEHGHIETVKALLKLGAPVNSANEVRQCSMVNEVW
jgi:ankyrin repeat protein